MLDYRNILRVGSDPNKSMRTMELELRSSHHTIRKVLDAAERAGIRWPLPENCTNEMLMELLFPEEHQKTALYVLPDYPYIHAELARKGVNLTMLWEEYCAKCQSEGNVPYMYTQYCEKYRQWARVTKATMRIQHKPGDTMEVDWAGATLDIHDPVTGEVSKAYLFVAVLPCSCFTYAEACDDMKLENWINCHVHAYNYFGGVTRLLVPDNLKTGIAKNTRSETILNRTYQEMSEYYNTAIVPARVRHPRDKSHAEGGVKFASTWILAALRNRKLFSMEEARAAVEEKLEELNDRSFRKRPGSRREAYLAEEKEFMRPVPGEPYEPAIWSPDLKVGNDYLVSDGLNKYSVPYDLIGEKVNLRLTPNTVEVFFRGSRVAVHVRSKVFLREPVVKKEHKLQALLAIQHAGRDTQPLEVVHQGGLYVLQPGLCLPHGLCLNSECEIFRLGEAIVALSELCFQHLAVLIARIVEAIAAIRDANALFKDFRIRCHVHKGQLEVDGAVKEIQKGAPLLKNSGLILLLGQLIVDVLILDGLGVIPVADTADSIREHTLKRNRLLGRAGNSVITLRTVNDFLNLPFLCLSQVQRHGQVSFLCFTEQFFQHREQ